MPGLFSPNRRVLKDARVIFYVEQVRALRDGAKRLANLSREGREWVRRHHGYERHLELLEEAYFGAAAPERDMPIAM